MEDFDKGAKRKCTSCSTLFFDFGKVLYYVQIAELPLTLYSQMFQKEVDHQKLIK